MDDQDRSSREQQLLDVARAFVDEELPDSDSDSDEQAPVQVLQPSAPRRSWFRRPRN